MYNSHNSDFLIPGGGLYGSATAYHLAKNGTNNIVVLECRAVCSSGTAKSCAIVRTHYSIKANLIHAVESWKIFANFNEIVRGDFGFHRTGYIILGPKEHRGPMEAVFHPQNEHGIDTAVLTPTEAHDFHPLLKFEDVGVIGHDTLAGYADPYLTTTYAKRTQEHGVTICS